MDLGIAGKTGLVTAASRGFGRACAQSLAREGVKVTIVARTPGPLQDAADEISTATGTEVSTVVADIVSEAGRAAVL
ncbi:MAG: SDR family NAD(P)-dependent oxidoreductase, partial [Rhodospirillales bacterium]|nr:SDR family NAD(P)-dependent oxidoreductase [Rhodospirillales bacterium]